MDIYFCDLCGVRVTDADLRAGHGMRDGHDVICSACLELGHHKEWLNRRAKTKPPVIAARATPRPGDAADRVATLDEDVPPSPVAPKIIVAELTPSGALPVLPEDHTATAKVPTPGQPSEMPLAGAASLFSALGSSPAHANGSTGTDSRPGEDDDDDLLDQADQPRVTTTPEPAASPFADEASENAENAEKAETALVATRGGLGKAATDEVPAIDEAVPPAKPRASTGSGGRDKGEARKSTSSRHSKPAGKGKSTRTARGRSGPDASRMILMGSMISLGIIVLIFGAVIAHKKHLFGGRTTPGAVGFDDKELKELLNKTKTTVNDALRSDNLSELEAAKAALDNLQDKMEQFENTALRSGNSQEKIDAFVESLHASDVYMQRTPINQRLIIKHQQGEH